MSIHIPITGTGGAIRLPKVLLTLFLLGFLITGPVQAQDDTVQVQAEGVSAYQPTDPALTREQALEAAFRDAVEKTSGIVVESETRARNFELVKDEVLTRSKGFIRSYKVVAEGRERGDIFRIRIDALVVRAAFLKDMEAALESLYRRVGKPRVMVAILESGLDKNGKPLGSRDGTLKGAAEKEIRKMLIKSGFTLIDVRHDQVLERASQGDETARARLVRTARTGKADLVILGRATTQHKGANSGFNMAQADLSADVIRVDSGQIIASEIADARGLNVNQSTAAVMSLQNAARKITPRMMEQVTYVWLRDKSQGTRMELVVLKAAFADLVTLKRALTAQIPGVKQVKQRSFDDGTGLIELYTRKPVGEVAEALQEIRFPQFRLNVEKVRKNRLTVKVVKP